MPNMDEITIYSIHPDGQIPNNPEADSLYPAAIDEYLETNPLLTFEPPAISENSDLYKHLQPKEVQRNEDGQIVGGLMLCEDDPEYIKYLDEFSELYEIYIANSVPNDAYYAQVGDIAEISQKIEHVKEVVKKVSDLITYFTTKQLPSLSQFIAEDNWERPMITERRVAELLINLKYLVDTVAFYDVAKRHFSREMLAKLSVSRLRQDLITNGKTNVLWEIVYLGSKEAGLISEEQYQQEKSRINYAKLED